MMQPDGNFVMTPEAEIYLDTAVPNMARIFDYLLGGTVHFEADRETADNLLKHIPSFRKWIRLHRAFIQEAARALFNKGFIQFLDLGSGMPGENHLHESIPTARIIYSDINPVAVSYGQSLFAEFVNLDYIYGNARQIDQILNAPAVRRLIDLREKIAIGLNTIMLFLNEAQNRQLAQALHAWAPPGSQIFVVFQTRSQQATSAAYTQMLSLSQTAGLPMRFYTRDQYIEMLKPWRSGQVRPLTRFLGLPDDFITETDRAGVGVDFYAAFLSKEVARSHEQP